MKARLHKISDTLRSGSLKHNVPKAWTNIDVPLKQRHDELPKRVKTCKQYVQNRHPTP